MIPFLGSFIRFILKLIGQEAQILIKEQMPKQPEPDYAPRELVQLSPIRFAILECMFPPKSYNSPEMKLRADNFEGYVTRKYERDFDKLDETQRIVVASGLVTYGRLEVVEFLINTLPEQTQAGKDRPECLTIASKTMDAMLPLPDAIRPKRNEHIDKKAIESWNKTYQDQLIWDTQAEKFVLKDG